MSLMPEVEDRLVQAAEQHYGRARRRQLPRLQPRPRRSTRTLLVMFATLGIAVPAVAATHAWEPILGKPSADGQAPRVATDTIPADQLQMLSVLRRDQTDQDHSAATLGLLEPLAPTTDGVRLQGIRLLSAGDGDPAVALIPVAQLFKRFPNEGGGLLARDALCLTDASNVVCATSDQVKAGGLTGFEGNYVYGLVPDGVATVRFDYADGSSVRLPVHDDYYGAKVAALPTIPQSDTSHLTLMLQRDPATDTTPRTAATMTWLDAQGHEVLRVPNQG
jgi:hypothetical protein